MLRKQILSVFNPLRYCRRYYAFVEDATEKHEQWRTQVFNRLVSDYGHKQLIRKLFRENPQYGTSDFNVWKRFMGALCMNGFEYQDCFNILKNCPEALGYAPEQLGIAANQWRDIFQLDMMKFLIMNNPEFLNLDAKCIKKRGTFLLSYCLSKEMLMTMLFLCPNLMYDDWEAILKKIEFLDEEMVVYRSEVFQCKALSKPLKHIKLRFSIVEKCGLYIRPNPDPYKQTKKERLKLNNPKLKDITDKSDASFAKKVAKISLEEYDTYSELFDKHENEYSDSDLDSDEED